MCAITFEVQRNDTENVENLKSQSHSSAFNSYYDFDYCCVAIINSITERTYASQSSTQSLALFHFAHWHLCRFILPLHVPTCRISRASIWHQIRFLLLRNQHPHTVVVWPNVRCQHSCGATMKFDEIIVIYSPRDTVNYGWRSSQSENFVISLHLTMMMRCQRPEYFVIIYAHIIICPIIFDSTGKPGWWWCSSSVSPSTVIVIGCHSHIVVVLIF